MAHSPAYYHRADIIGNETKNKRKKHEYILVIGVRSYVRGGSKVRSHFPYEIPTKCQLSFEPLCMYFFQIVCSTKQGVQSTIRREHFIRTRVYGFRLFFIFFFIPLSISNKSRKKKKKYRTNAQVVNVYTRTK